MVAGQTDGATGALSPFQSFMTALAASIGTGQHRRRGHRHHLGRSGRALLDLGLRISSPRRSSSAEAVLGVKYRETAKVITLQLAARCITCATA
jgi:hypothetical protein